MTEQQADKIMDILDRALKPFAVVICVVALVHIIIPGILNIFLP
ncbi:MAG: hypothetical protein WC373_10775 [Smithella sp.]|jgi:hypothetical protein